MKRGDKQTVDVMRSVDGQMWTCCVITVFGQSSKNYSACDSFSHVQPEGGGGLPPSLPRLPPSQKLSHFPGITMDSSTLGLSEHVLCMSALVRTSHTLMFGSDGGTACPLVVFRLSADVCDIILCFVLSF